MSSNVKIRVRDWSGRTVAEVVPRRLPGRPVVAGGRPLEGDARRVGCRRGQIGYRGGRDRINGCHRRGRETHGGVELTFVGIEAHWVVARGQESRYGGRRLRVLGPPGGGEGPG